MERVTFEEIITGLAGRPAEDQSWAMVDLTLKGWQGRRVLKASKQFSVLTSVTVLCVKGKPAWGGTEYMFSINGTNSAVQDYLRLLDRAVNG